MESRRAIYSLNFRQLSQMVEMKRQAGEATAQSWAGLSAVNEVQLTGVILDGIKEFIVTCVVEISLLPIERLWLAESVSRRVLGFLQPQALPAEEAILEHIQNP